MPLCWNEIKSRALAFSKEWEHTVREEADAQPFLVKFLNISPVLVKAHQVLDKAVDQCYRSQPFTSEAKRIEYLFELYDKYTSGLFVKEKKVKSKSKK